MLLSQFIKSATTVLQNLYPTEEARSVVLLLCESVLGTKSYTHIIEPAFSVSPESLAILEPALDRLSKGEPVQYVLGFAEFCGRKFNVSSAVLVPRPETELLCHEALRIAENFSGKKRKIRILDLCTGSGCIAWTMALSVPNSEVVAVDISAEALAVAASQHFPDADGSSPRFVIADVLDTENFPDLGKFDMILSNPPYIMDSEKDGMRPNVLDYEPVIALFVPDDDPLLFYRQILLLGKRILATGGFGIFEINENLGPELLALVKKMGFSKSFLLKDLGGKDRFVVYG